MQRNRIAAGLLSPALFFLFLSLGAPVLAEEPEEGAPADEKIEGRSNPEQLGQWSIKKEVRTLERSLQKYDPLIQSLGEANDDLKADLEAYQGNPNDQVLASRMTLKMSAYAKKIIFDFDRIISSQDVLIDVFKELQRKLGKFTGYLGFKEKEYGTKAEEHRLRAVDLEKKLKDLAIQFKESDDEKTAEAAKREFTRIFREYKINERYVQGYNRNVKQYQALHKNLGSLVLVFDKLQEAFTQLIANLEMEKQFMMDNILLQRDLIQGTRFVHEAVSEGNLAIQSISQKLADLYNKVDVFAQVHERLNDGLANFADSQQVLAECVIQIDQVGALKAAPSIESAIDYFYNKPIDEED
ncbi:MAG: hypothetical protein HY720_19230 [Planctomycetes bacterium]|nr:hypothetical protein [Planctomycetota bacterium]